MGRGRAKAKQTKVARELKYRTFDTDLGALQRELATNGGGDGDSDSEAPDGHDTGAAEYSGNGRPADAEEDEDE